MICVSMIGVSMIVISMIVFSMVVVSMIVVLLIGVSMIFMLILRKLGIIIHSMSEDFIKLPHSIFNAMLFTMQTLIISRT